VPHVHISFLFNWSLSSVTRATYGDTFQPELTHCSHGTKYLPKIGYRSYQAVTQYDLENPHSIPHEQHPVEICYTTPPPGSVHTFNEVRLEFASHEATWKKSKACKNLEQQLMTVSSPNISRIVGFGLGSLQWLGDRAGARSHTQIAALKTMAGILKKSSPHEIQCYVQDPMYCNVSKEFLQSIGIVVLDDPKGFLEVDENTLVFSVCPNVPVKQIVADLQWPAAMIWDTVNLEESETRQWRTESWDGEEHRVR
jgi:hypothetical protein